jgi:hypothetical protein
MECIRFCGLTIVVRADILIAIGELVLLTETVFLNGREGSNPNLKIEDILIQRGSQKCLYILKEDREVFFYLIFLR